MTALIITADKIGLPSLADWFKRLQAKLAHRAQINKTVKQLSALSDRELWDIGIGRGDIYNVATGDNTLERVRRSAVDTNTNLKGWV